MIAREFNLSETTFIFSARPDKGVPLVRFFTPARELPFAGHPVIGTAAALANGIVKRTGSQPTAIDFEVPAGLVDGQDQRSPRSLRCNVYRSAPADIAPAVADASTSSGGLRPSRGGCFGRLSI